MINHEAVLIVDARERSWQHARDPRGVGGTHRDVHGTTERGERPRVGRELRLRTVEVVHERGALLDLPPWPRREFGSVARAEQHLAARAHHEVGAETAGEE